MEGGAARRQALEGCLEPRIAGRGRHKQPFANARFVSKVNCPALIIQIAIQRFVFLPDVMMFDP